MWYKAGMESTFLEFQLWKLLALVAIAFLLGLFGFFKGLP
jgi:hypothetical protein